MASLIRAWLHRPVSVDMEARPDAIVPATAMLGLGKVSRNGRVLLLPAARLSETRRGGQIVLPGFGEQECMSLRVPALPLELYDLGASRGETRGTPMRYFITLRQIQDILYPLRI